MFRDPDFYQALRREVIPLLRTYPFVRIWHAGCSTGRGGLFAGHPAAGGGPLRALPPLRDRPVSDAVLDKAKRGIFPLPAMRDYTAAYQHAGGRQDFSSYYVADQKNAILRQTLRKNIIFSQHNLPSDGAFNEFHLILCRNVGIYFDESCARRCTT